MLRAGRNFQRAHAQAFQNLQQPEVSGRLDGDGVPWPGDRAQGQVQGFDAAVRDDDVIRRGVDAIGQRPTRQHRAQIGMPLRRYRADQHVRRRAQRARHRLLQRVHWISLRHRGRQREVGADGVGFALGDEVRDAVMDADVLRGAQRLADVGLVDRGNAVSSGLQDEIARPWPGFDQAVVFQLAAGLQRRG
ncbi:hypothetical protein D3C78_1415000 [compost metagenome]